MIVNNLSFGSVTIDGETYEKDVIIDNCRSQGCGAGYHEHS